MMQLFWSRVAQTRSSCHCTSCLQAASAIARRTPNAASKRRLQFGDLFTACYSTILGTAVFVDAKVKNKRRNEWDRAIAEAKAGIPMDKPGGIERTVPIPDHVQSLPIEETKAGMPMNNPESIERRVPISNYHVQKDGPERIEHTVPVSNHLQDLPIAPTWDGTRWIFPPLETQLKTVDFHLRQSLEVAAKKDPQALPSEVEDPNSAREPRSRLHLRKMEEMISKLVSQLLVARLNLRKSNATLSKEPSLLEDTPLQLTEMSEPMSLLQASNTQLPQYTWPDAISVARERWGLNNSLRALFERVEPDCSNIDVILAKICYNLLVSTAPPSVQTYNILIGNLTRLRLQELTQVVVNSFLSDSRFKPNSVTIQNILNHYTAKKDASGFRDITRRMSAVDQDMRIKRRSLKTLSIPRVKQWATANKVIGRNDHLSQKVHRDSKIFDSLIKGCLTIADIRGAVRHVRAAFREGQLVYWGTLIDVMEACLRVLDSRASRLLLQALSSLLEEGSTHTLFDSCRIRHLVHQLLALCGIEPSQKSKPNKPHTAFQVSMQNLLCHINMRSVEHALNTSSELIASLENALGVQRSRPAVFKYNNAVSGTDDGLVKSVLMKISDMPQENIYKGIDEALGILRRVSDNKTVQSAERNANRKKIAFLKRQVIKSKRSKESVVIRTDKNGKQVESLKLKSAKSNTFMETSVVGGHSLTDLYQELSPEWRVKYDAVIRHYPYLSWSYRLVLFYHFFRGEDITLTDRYFRAMMKSQRANVRERGPERYEASQRKLLDQRDSKSRRLSQSEQHDRISFPQTLLPASSISESSHAPLSRFPVAASHVRTGLAAATG
jgi:hypothetical protein